MDLSPYETAIQLYNETLNRELSKNAFIAELEKRGLTKDEALISYVELCFALKTARH